MFNIKIYFFIEIIIQKSLEVIRINRHAFEVLYIVFKELVENLRASEQLFKVIQKRVALLVGY